MNKFEKKTIIDKVREYNFEVAGRGKTIRTAEVIDIVNAIFEDSDKNIRPEIMAFAEAMEAMMARHDEKKGDSWKTMSEEDLIDLMGEHVENWWNDYEYGSDIPPDDYVDIANIAMMIWHKAKGEQNA